MQRRHTILATSIGLAGLTLLMGWGAGRCGATGLGPLPAEAIRLPPDSRFIMGLDVRRFVAGAFYRRFAGPNAPARPQSFNELAHKVGIDPDHDVDRVFFAGGLGPDGRRGVLLALGRFDPAQLSRSLGERHPDLVTREVGRHPLHVLSASPRSTAVALVGDGALALGPTEYVEGLLAGTDPGISGNGPLAALLRGISDAPTFWLVGDGSAIEMAMRSAPGASGGIPLGLPPLESVVVTSSVDPKITFVAVAQATQETGARALGEMLNGFLALATLQASQQPALKDLPSAIKVRQEGTRVTLSGEIPHDMLSALMPKSKPRTVSPAPKTTR